MQATLILMPQDQPCELCDHAIAVLDRVSADMPLEVTVLHEGTPEAAQAAQQAGAAAIRPLLIVDGFAQSYGRLSEGRLRRDLDSRLRKVC